MHCAKYLSRPKRGFSIVELLIVVTVVTVLLAVGFRYIRDRGNDAQRESWIALEAKEFTLVSKALSSYISTNKGTWTNNQRVDISVAQLKAAGLLSTGFASRPPNGSSTAADGTTPWAEVYACVAYKDNGGIVRGVVRESGTVLTTKLNRSGVEYETNAILALKKAIADKSQVGYQLIAGTVPAGGLTAAGSSGSFTQDLTAYLQTAPANAEVVSLVSWPEYDTTTVGAGPKWGQCHMIQAEAGCSDFGQVGQNSACSSPGATWALPTCPAGETNVGSAPACGTEISGTDVGTLTSGYDPRSLVPGSIFSCSASCPAGSGNSICGNADGTRHDTASYGVTSLNDREQGRRMCSASGWSTNASYNSCTSPFLGTWQSPMNGKRSVVCCLPR